MKILQESPFLSRCDSLKKKMAAFQSLMEEEEDEEDEQKKNEENESSKSTLAKDSENGQSLLKLLIAVSFRYRLVGPDEILKLLRECHTVIACYFQLIELIQNRHHNKSDAI